MEEQPWPYFPENEKMFNWTLSMREIEKKYSPIIENIPIVEKKKAVVVEVERVVKTETAEEVKVISVTVLQRIAKKYPYAFSQLTRESIDDSMWKWIYDNYLNKN